MRHLTREELHAGLDDIRQAPADNGELVLIVTRPEPGERHVLAEGQLDAELGLVGDNWLVRGSRQMADGKAAPDKQVTVMNVRVSDLVAVGRERVPLAGDQLFVDFDISMENVPAGSRLYIGDAVLEVSASPHLGCAKFVNRFGIEAMRFVNSSLGRSLRMRGLNARVVEPGAIRVGDRVRRSAPAIPAQVEESVTLRT